MMGILHCYYTVAHTRQTLFTLTGVERNASIACFHGFHAESRVICAGPRPNMRAYAGAKGA